MRRLLPCSRLAPWSGLAAVLPAAVVVALAGCGGAQQAPSTPVPRPAAGRVIPPSPGRTPHQLSATVTPQGQVTALTAPGGRAVTRLRSGWYSVRIAVDSMKANFDLVGPNVHRKTTPHSMDLAIWGIHFLPGTYRYLNDTDPSATSHEISVH
jgi:hypothetical protein